MPEKVSESAQRLRVIIEKAIEEHKITRDDYDRILNIASEDGVIDKHERALFVQLQQMIEDGDIRWSKK